MEQIDDNQPMSIALLQDNNAVRFPISTLRIAPIQEYDYSQIVNSRQLRQQNFESVQLVIPEDENNVTRYLDGTVKRYQFKQGPPKRKKEYRRKDMKQPPLKLPQIQQEASVIQNEVLYDKKIELDWFTNDISQSNSKSSPQQSQFYLDTMKFEEDTIIQEKKLQKVKQRIKPQTIPLNGSMDAQQAKLPFRGKKAVAPRYKEIKTQQLQTAIFQSHRNTYLIPSNLLAPELTDPKKLTAMREVNYLRGKYFSSNQSPIKRPQKLVSNEPVQADEEVEPIAKPEHRLEEGEQYLMIKINNQGGARVHKGEKVKVKSKTQISKEREEEKRIEHLLEVRRQRIEQMKKQRNEMSAPIVVSVVSESDNETEPDFQQILSTQQDISRLKQMRSCVEHQKIITKLKRLTNKLIEGHVIRDKSTSLDKVMDFQVDLINSNSKISKKSMQEMQYQFASVLQPLNPKKHHSPS